MIRKISLTDRAIVLAVTALLLLAPGMVLAQPDLGLNYVDPIGLQAGNFDDPQSFAASVVTYLLTFLGIIAVIIILYGGFLWMTAAGNEDRVSKAKKTIIAGAIGLVIILASYAIVTFVIDFSNRAIQGNI
jgi:uncharacterized membrane protein YidH (DUF202 family)